MLDDPAIQVIIALIPLYMHQLWLSRKIGRFGQAIKMLHANQQSMHDYHLSNPDHKDGCPMCASKQSEQNECQHGEQSDLGGAPRSGLFS